MIISENSGHLFDEINLLKKIVSVARNEYSILRTSLLPNLLQVIKNNLAQKNNNIAAFEIGRIHFLDEEKSVEIPMLALLLTGSKEIPSWSEKSKEVDFFDLKGIIENLIKASYLPSNHLSFHPGRQADIVIDDLIIGSIGELHPRLLLKFHIEKPVYYAELNILHLLEKRKTHLKMKPLPQFPASERDWTVRLPLKMEIDQIFKAIRLQKSSLLEKIELIDLYLPEGHDEKNATFRFTYRDPLKTISFQEVEAEHAKIIQNLDYDPSKR